MSYRSDCPLCQQRTFHLHASELGSCLRAQVAALLNFTAEEHSDSTKALFAAGHAHEAEAVAKMVSEGWLVHRCQEEVSFFGVPGHIDGAGGFAPEGVLLGPERLIEYKKPESWTKFERCYKTGKWDNALSVTQAWQVSLYQHALNGIEAVIACVDDDHLKWFVIETPIHSAQQIHDRVEEAELMYQAGEPGLHRAKCDPWAESFWCQMSAVTGCRDKARLAIPDDDGTLSARLEKYFTLTTIVQQGDAAKKERDKVKKELDGLLPVGDLQVGHYSVTTWDHPNPKRFDEAAMQADGVLDKYLLPKTSHRRMNVE